MKIQMYIRPLLSLWLFLFGCAISAEAQSPEALVEAVYERYAQVEHLSFEWSTIAFATADAEEGELTARGTFKKRGDAFYTKAWDREMIVNGERMLVIDHRDQKIVKGRTFAVASKTAEVPYAALEAFLAAGGSLTLLESERGKRGYALDLPTGLIARLELYLRPDHLIDRIRYYYRSSPEAEPVHPILEVRYREVSLAAPAAAIFDEAQYLERAPSGAWRATSRYREYRVKEVSYDDFSTTLF